MQSIDEMETLPAAGPLKVRIGLATGQVIVSDLFPGGADDKQTIFGSCPNLAARLQTVAGPNEVVIAERTHQRVRSLFSCELLGKIDVRGFGSPREAWRVVGEAKEAEVTPGTSASPPFAGRDDELDLLESLWGSVERGRGAAALVVGEAGIGKSRLIQEFLAHRIPPTTPILSAFASPFDADSPLRPVVDLLQKAAGIDTRDDRQAVVTKLMNVLTGDHQQKRLAADILVGLFGFAAGE